MTNREFLIAVSTLETASEELKAEAVARIEKLDAANEARKAKTSKKAQENAPLLDKIADEILTSEAQTAATIAETLGVSVQKASSLCRTLVNDGRAESVDVKIPKKGTQKAYFLAETVDEEADAE